MNHPVLPNLVILLANDFTRRVRDNLTYSQLLALRRVIQTTPEYSNATLEEFGLPCAMNHAFKKIVGHDFDESKEGDSALWTASGSVSKGCGFARTPELIRDDEGQPVYAYLIDSHWIRNPRLTFCLRYSVEPSDEYGITPDEIEALKNANAILQDPLFEFDPICSARGSECWPVQPTEGKATSSSNEGSQPLIVPTRWTNMTDQQWGSYLLAFTRKTGHSIQVWTTVPNASESTSGPPIFSASWSDRAGKVTQNRASIAITDNGSVLMAAIADEISKCTLTGMGYAFKEIKGVGTALARQFIANNHEGEQSYYVFIRSTHGGLPISEDEPLIISLYDEATEHICGECEYSDFDLARQFLSELAFFVDREGGHVDQYLWDTP